ncbi:MAG: vanadium-dependent haloperoxidase [Chitinophagaceae bacterium]
MNKIFIVFVLVSFCIFSCKQKKDIVLKNTEILHNNQDQLTQVIIYDVFTPPVAARIYAYTSLASYEAVRFMSPGNPSLAEKMHGFGKMPVPDTTKEYNYVLAATQAFFTVAHKITFSIDTLKKYETPLFARFKESLDDSVYNRSLAFGDTIAKIIAERFKTDHYLKSRGKPKFLGSQEAGKWRPTPPDYLDGVEYCWNEMSTFVIDSANQFPAIAPPVFSMDTASEFFKMVKDVYLVTKTLTPEQVTIAKFWDDNPFVIEHSGHMMFGNKKITPGGHWMGIAAIACKQTHADEVKIAKAYAITAVALFDAFVSCWDIKYKTNYIRPVSVINESIEQTWTPLLQTPPFPEYTSGHSTITGSCAVALTHLFGDDFAFTDTSDLRYIGMKRDFKSFLQAADECSISRLYGGIHYRFTVIESGKLGKQIGEFIMRRLEE